ncbi:MAG: glycosyltransferase family 1 protein [Thermodesulfobacteriota bacterium]
MNPGLTIGVDARPLSAGLAGIPRYVGEMLAGLVRTSRHRFVLFSNREIACPFPAADNVTIVVDGGFAKVPGTLWLMFRLNRLLEEHKVDFFWGTQHLLPFFKSPLRKYVVTVHDLTHLILPQSLRFHNLVFSRLFFKRAMGNADGVICISRATSKDLIEHYPFMAERRVEVIYPGRSLVFPRQDSNPHRQDYLFTLGSLEPRKNLLFLVKTFRHLAERRPNLKLLCAGGEGWKARPLFRYVQDHGLADRVLFPGRISDLEAADYMARARLLVFPSLYEGFGLPLLEAVDKCPAAASDIEVFRELKPHLANLFLLDFRKDPHLSAQRLLEILDRPDLEPLRFQGQSGGLFTWTAAAEKTLAFFNEIMVAAGQGEGGS